MTHDYVRNGTTSLFAAFDLARGSVIAQPYRRLRHQEFLRFLKLIDSAVPDDLDLHRSWTTTPRKSRQMQRPGANLAGITEPGRAACRYHRHPSDMAPAAPAGAPGQVNVRARPVLEDLHGR
jgi:hypothetical protein